MKKWIAWICAVFMVLGASLAQAEQVDEINWDMRYRSEELEEQLKQNKLSGAHAVVHGTDQHAGAGRGKDGHCRDGEYPRRGTGIRFLRDVFCLVADVGIGNGTCSGNSR